MFEDIIKAKEAKKASELKQRLDRNLQTLNAYKIVQKQTGTSAKQNLGPSKTPASIVSAPASIVSAPASIVSAPASIVSAPASIVSAPASIVSAPAPGAASTVSIHDYLIRSRQEREHKDTTKRALDLALEREELIKDREKEDAAQIEKFNRQIDEARATFSARARVEAELETKRRIRQSFYEADKHTHKFTPLVDPSQLKRAERTVTGFHAIVNLLMGGLQDAVAALCGIDRPEKIKTAAEIAGEERLAATVLAEKRAEQEASDHRQMMFAIRQKEIAHHEQLMKMRLEIEAADKKAMEKVELEQAAQALAEAEGVSIIGPAVSERAKEIIFCFRQKKRLRP